MRKESVVKTKFLVLLSALLIAEVMATDLRLATSCLRSRRVLNVKDNIWIF